MKKTLLLIVTILLVTMLSACAQKPFQPPKGAVFVERDYISFDYFNGKTTEELYRFDFINALYYFDGPFENNINFTAINNYETASSEFSRFLASLDNRYIDKVAADYGGKIVLSLKATETNYNEIELAVSEIYDVEGHFVTEDGLQLIVLYTEFTKDNKDVVVPTSIFAFTHEIYHLTDITANKTMQGNGNQHYVNFGYDTLLVPVPHKSYSEVVSPYLNEDASFEQPVLISLNDFSEICSPSDSYCVGDSYTELKVYIDSTTTKEMVHDFYIDYFGGETIGDDFVFYNDNVAFTVTMEEIDGNITLMIQIYE